MNFLVHALATYRITRLIQEDEVWNWGKIRSRLQDQYAHTLSIELLHCPWCLSPYASAALLVLKAVSPRLAGVLTQILAASAVAGMISTALDYIHSNDAAVSMMPN